MCILGTFITEWGDGSEKCSIFFANKESAERTARQLTAIAAFYKFEGWLINIENEMEAAIIPNLLLFIRYSIPQRALVEPGRPKLP